MSNQPITPQQLINQADEQEGEAHVMLGGSWGLMPGLADAMNGWRERCDLLLNNYPNLNETEKENYHREFFKAIWAKLGATMENEYIKSLQVDENDS
jgi:hypothetical protein